jgi:hypothetical protein
MCVVLVKKVASKIDSLSSFEQEVAREYGTLFLHVDELRWLHDTLKDLYWDDPESPHGSVEHPAESLTLLDRVRRLEEKLA